VKAAPVASDQMAFGGLLLQRSTGSPNEKEEEANTRSEVSDSMSSTEAQGERRAVMVTTAVNNNDSEQQQ
jgi:hypothetical protein